MVRLDVAPAPEALTGADSYGRPPFGNELAARRYNLIVARAGAVADQPGKLLAAAGRAPETVTDRYQKLLREVRSELTLVSPYFIPGKVGVERLREMRDRGVAVRVITNATSASDEPLVNMATARYRRELLRMGVRLFEVDSSRLMRDAAIRGLFRSSTGRLHAKVALIDRELVLLGSMNVDPRSAFLNTGNRHRCAQPGARTTGLAFARPRDCARRLRAAVAARWQAHRVGRPRRGGRRAAGRRARGELAARHAAVPDVALHRGRPAVMRKRSASSIAPCPRPLLMVLASLLFATMGVCVKLASAHYGAGEIVFYRGAGRRAGDRRADHAGSGGTLRTACRRCTSGAALTGVTALCLWFYAIGNLPLATAMTLNYMSSVWMALFLIGGAVLLGAARVDARLVATVLVGFAGVALILRPTIEQRPALARPDRACCRACSRRWPTCRSPRSAAPASPSTAWCSTSRSAASAPACARCLLAPAAQRAHRGAARRCCSPSACWRRSRR